MDIVKALKAVETLMRTGRKVTAEITCNGEIIVSCRIADENEGNFLVSVLKGDNWDVFICPCEDFNARNLNYECAMQIGHNMEVEQIKDALEVLKDL